MGNAIVVEATGFEQLYLSGGYGDNADDVLRGLGQSDTLHGNGGDDDLFGDAGQDLLSGSTGADHLFGGAGQDRFTYYDVADSPGRADTDVIGDFVGGSDVLDLGYADANAVGGGFNGSFVFIGTAAFSHIAGQLRFSQDLQSSTTAVQADTNGDGKADLTIEMTSLVTLQTTDFAL